MLDRVEVIMNQASLLAQNDDVSVKRVSVTTQIAVRLRKEIVAGVYKPGDSLPSERELAERFGVSRISIRHAIQELALEGWISVVQGKGATVLDFRGQLKIDAASSLLVSCPQVVVTPETFITMHDFANWLSEQIYHVAARNAGPGDRAILMEIISRYKEKTGVKEYFQIYADLHYELLRISNNLVLHMFFNSYMDVLLNLMNTGILDGPPLSRKLFENFFGEIVSAICGDEDDISAIIKKYVPDIKAELGQYLKPIGVNI